MKYIYFIVLILLMPIFIGYAYQSKQHWKECRACCIELTAHQEAVPIPQAVKPEQVNDVPVPTVEQSVQPQQAEEVVVLMPQEEHRSILQRIKHAVRWIISPSYRHLVSSHRVYVCS